jgi:hypothetical protein
MRAVIELRDCVRFALCLLTRQYQSKVDLPGSEEASRSVTPPPLATSTPSLPSANSPVLNHATAVESSDEEEDGSGEVTSTSALRSISPTSNKSSPRPRGVAAVAAMQFHADTSSDNDSEASLHRSPPPKPQRVAGDVSSEEEIVHWG